MELIALTALTIADMLQSSIMRREIARKGIAQGTAQPGLERGQRGDCSQPALVVAQERFP
jgi:hypothetical protein